jgi:hypothetical protein
LPLCDAKVDECPSKLIRRSESFTKEDEEVI